MNGFHTDYPYVIMVTLIHATTTTTSTLWYNCTCADGKQITTVTNDSKIAFTRQHCTMGITYEIHPSCSEDNNSTGSHSLRP